MIDRALCGRRQQNGADRVRQPFQHEQIGARDSGQGIAARERHSPATSRRNGIMSLKSDAGTLRMVWRNAFGKQHLVGPRCIEETDVARGQRRSLIALLNAAGPVLLKHQEPGLFCLHVDQLAGSIDPLRIGHDVQKIEMTKILKRNGTADGCARRMSVGSSRGRASTPAMVWHTTSRQNANRRSAGTLAVVTSLAPRICSAALDVGRGQGVWVRSHATILSVTNPALEKKA